MIAIDTNVFVYSIDSTDSAKHTVAKQVVLDLAFKNEAVLLWQVAAELLRWLRKAVEKGNLQQFVADNAFREIRDAFDFLAPTNRALDLSLNLFGRYSLSHWDSLLLAACIDAKIDTLYTEDLTHGVTYEGVRAVNPFSKP